MWATLCLREREPKRRLKSGALLLRARGASPEILVYLARGRTKSYIANELFVTENTVRSHVRNIYSKLEVHTRQELLDLVELGEPHA